MIMRSLRSSLIAGQWGTVVQRLLCRLVFTAFAHVYTYLPVDPENIMGIAVRGCHEIPDGESVLHHGALRQKPAQKANQQQ